MYFKNNKSDITFGVVAPVFWTDHYISGIKGIRDAAEKYNANILLIQGVYSNNLHSSNNDFVINDTGNIIFDIIKKENLNAIIILVGPLRLHTLKMHVVEKCKKFAPVPIVNIGAELDGLTNVLVDNKKGMKELLHHLIKVHGYRKIGFIRGTEDNVDANLRFTAYLDTLKESNISIDTNYVSRPGKWSSLWGMEATRELLYKTNNELDAIVCASDLLVVGAYEELEKRDISIRDHVAVVGFNDSTFASTHVPPISTVQLNIYERSWKAVEMLIDYTKGKQLPQKKILPSTIVIRQSCGCPSLGIMAIDAIKLKKSEKNTEGNRIEHSEYKKILVNKVRKILKTSNVYEESLLITTVIDNFLKQLNDLSKETFISDFSKILQSYSFEKDELMNWHWVLNVFEDQLHSIVQKKDINKAHTFLFSARMLISEFLEQKHKVCLMQAEERNARVNSLSYDLNKVNSLKKIIELLALDLPEIGIQTCYLSLYNDMDNPLKSARLIFALDKSRVISLPSEGIPFSPQQLVPDGIVSNIETSTMIIEPLYYNTHQLGFVIYEFGTMDRSFYELFSVKLSASLWGIYLSSKGKDADAALEEQTKKLEHTNIELKKWTSQLESAYSQLKENQAKILIADKMASLGRLTAKITHEMTSPIEILEASLSELQTFAEVYLNSANDISVSPDFHFMMVEDICNAINLADKAAEMTAMFISSMKAQTRDIKDSSGQTFNVVDIVDEVVIFLGHSIKKNRCKVSVSSSHEIIEIAGSPTKMIQILTNLITNSLEALGNDKDGEISISLDIQTDCKKCILIVADNGQGMGNDIQKKIFDSMFTTKPFGHGTGLGLSIVHDIIVGEFGGEINVSSELGKGTKFIIHLNTI